ncbi:Ubiquitin-conjugating enzyme [Colletotrichum higginsianum IMI 349063]|uniref:Ubiquitin-conjugating enzyme n=1 Tax=Colletotrichum higginsianum (strain IMI 349063) TaxID=759273 RepID=A0A1B7XRK8_COLHI|nr:Ubiquitin-conjugating enzyme [Colletotrichum higginsianum IMI 349063]OBR02390.1 Ubiquitin-conjugating enzyme [Colletotrichum higginsianum IMI 349063]
MNADAETAEMTDVADDVADEAKRACVTTVLDVFPGICPDFLDKTAAKFQYNPDKTIEDILGLDEDGKPYPKRFYFKILKRKREGPEDPDDEATILRTYNYPGRMKESTREYIVMAYRKKLLKQEFPSATMSSILKIFASKDNQLLPAYMAVDAAMKENQWSPGKVYVNIAYKKSPTSTDPQYEGIQLDNTIQLTNNPEEKRALQELQAARKLLLKRKEAIEKENAERHNLFWARELGEAKESTTQVPFFYLLRAVENTANVAKFFCVGCAQQAAETAVGQSKYELACMSMDICEAGFSHQERQKFLTDQLSSALDRIENEAVLRMAGIENLERCPFCPYAAEYPPANTNREFRCDNPDCQKVSCRLCKEETHVPKTCEENTRDNGIKAKHEIEEAMSAAMIRKCNKCGTPFIKDEGCNKMTCVAANCANIQCYVCSQSCDYSHFNDPARGGKQGNCPLFDDVNARHNAEVQRAEEEARQKVLESNLQINRDMLMFDKPERKRAKPVGKLIHEPTHGLKLSEDRIAMQRPRLKYGDYENLPAVRNLVANRALAAQAQVAAQPGYGQQHTVGQLALQSNVGKPQQHGYDVPPLGPGDRRQSPSPRQAPAPRRSPGLQEAPGPLQAPRIRKPLTHNGPPAGPLVGNPHQVHGSVRSSPERAEDMNRFATPQYQPPPQAQQAQAPGPRQPGDFRGLHNVDDRRQLLQRSDSPEVNPFKRRINYQPRRALVRPDNEARPETPMSLMDLRKPMDRDKSVQRLPDPIPALQVSPQQESANRAQRLRGSLHDGWSMATHGRNHQGAQQSHNGERSVVANVCAEYLRKRDVRQLAADDEAPTVPDWTSIWRQAVAKGDEPDHATREDFTGGTEVGYGAVDVRSRAPEAAVPVAHVQSQSNGFNLNGLLQPPAPNRPNWLVEARRRGMARGMLEPAGGNSKDKPFVLD